MKSALGLKPDFPVFTLTGFITSLIGIVALRPFISDYVPSPYYSITVDGADFIIFTELSISCISNELTISNDGIFILL